MESSVGPVPGLLPPLPLLCPLANRVGFSWTGREHRLQKCPKHLIFLANILLQAQKPCGLHGRFRIRAPTPISPLELTGPGHAHGPVPMPSPRPRPAGVSRAPAKAAQGSQETASWDWRPPQGGAGLEEPPSGAPTPSRKHTGQLLSEATLLFGTAKKKRKKILSLVLVQREQQNI